MQKPEKPSKNVLLKMYCQDYLNRQQIADHFQRSRRTIDNWLKDYHITKFSLVKKNYFKTMTPESAWILGIIYTDGYLNIDKKGKRCDTIRISQKNPEILYKIKELLKLPIDVRLSSNSYGKEINHLEIHVVDIVQDIKDIGLTSSKSLDMVFPEMSREVIRHFIRGCWDGDGGFAYSGKKLTAH